MDELAIGIRALREIFEGPGILKLASPQILKPGFWYYFEAAGHGKIADFTLSREELADLPGTKSYLQSATGFARAVEKRLRNPTPSSFLTTSGIPLAITCDWPEVPWPGHPASYVVTQVTNLKSSLIAKCFVVITHQQHIFELKRDPFRLHGLIVNSIREAVDANQLTFHEPAKHPVELQRVNLQVPRGDRKAPLEPFLERKVFELAFQQAGKNSLVWIADPWDAVYLGSDPADLIRSAEVMEAHDILSLDGSSEFASPSKDLIRRASSVGRVGLAGVPRLRPVLCRGRRENLIHSFLMQARK